VKLDYTCRLIDKLPANNRELLRHVIRVLQHISHHSEVNQMTSSNLGVCIGQSLLWPADQSTAANVVNQRKSSGWLSNSGKQRPQSLVLNDICDEFKDASLPPLIVQLLIDSADEIFENDDWSPTMYEDIPTTEVLAAACSKSFSSLDDSDVAYGNYWTCFITYSLHA
jgi:RhoGAP domain